MHSSFGNNLKLTIYGASHDVKIGIALEGIPAGLPVDMVQLQNFLNRRPHFYPLVPDPYSHLLGTQMSQWHLIEVGLCKLFPAGRLESVSVSGTHPHLCRAKAAEDNRQINEGDRSATVLA